MSGKMYALGLGGLFLAIGLIGLAAVLHSPITGGIGSVIGLVAVATLLIASRAKPGGADNTDLDEKG